ncbi:hypothetical protein GGF42_006401 [Coemansia sp. RSA 2424]|nr:hypothetical protein GGF42_006401 [Coemansia sp. RSA 2424]
MSCPPLPSSRRPMLPDAAAAVAPDSEPPHACASAVLASAASPSPAEASPERKDDKSAPVRKRLSLACTTCRQRKVKCDGERPSCRTCAKFSWPCIYQPSNRKRGPRPRALALMDGSMPYSSRPHWTVSHSYYAYGYPSHSPLSPPPPPQPQPHFAAAHHHHPDQPLNGAPMQVDPARHQPGSYNHDSYSTYGDFVANTGVIRIRPPPMRSPGFGQLSPASMHTNRDAQVSYDFCRSEHMAQSNACGGEDRYASRHAPPERDMSACTLPFSDGVARPRLPPLSELLGKDYQHAMPSSGMQASADTQLGGGGSVSDRFVQPLSRRKDSFRDEVSKMLAHEGLH